MSQIIEEIEKAQMKETVPELNVGDTVNVSKIIVEGEKKRTQKFEGLIVKIQGRYSRTRFTVRKIIGKIGVEKTFLLHSELVPEIVVLKRGKVRRAKLNYLRERIGIKANRVKTRD